MSVKDARKPPFVWASVEALHFLREHWSSDRARAAVGLTVYHALCEVANEDHARAAIGTDSSTFTASRERIAEHACVSDRSVDSACAELERIGLLRVERQRTEGSERPGRASSYTLVEPETCEDSSHVAEEGRENGVQTSSEQGSHVGANGVRTSLHIEKKNSKKEETPKPPEGADSFSQEIFELWKQLTGRNGATKFSPKRQRAIRMRLKDGHTEDELRRAVIGCSKSDWHMKRGRHANRDGQRHDDLAFILRDTENVERFAAMAADLPVPSSRPRVSESAAAAETWAAVKDRVRESVSDSTFRVWIEPLEAGGERDGTLVLVDTTERGGAYIAKRYKHVILDGLGDEYADVEIVSPLDLELEAV